MCIITERPSCQLSCCLAAHVIHGLISKRQLCHQMSIHYSLCEAEAFSKRTVQQLSCGYHGAPHVVSSRFLMCDAPLRLVPPHAGVINKPDLVRGTNAECTE